MVFSSNSGSLYLEFGSGNYDVRGVFKSRWAKQDGNVAYSTKHSKIFLTLLQNDD